MADYKRMYLTLVDEVTNTIDNLKTALEKAEDIYIDTDKTIEKTETTNIHTQEENAKRPLNN